MCERRKNKECEKGETAQQEDRGTNTTGKNKDKLTHFLFKGGPAEEFWSQVSMTPSLQRTLLLFFFLCSLVPSSVP